ncbi:MAG: response regulator [Reyranella sp.]|uniref:response regulator transcription factor n=1 Tax=Reyranella sp. TaxID=1929291 RepID=UPI00120052FD|nr:response regulator [Reyranella sp.]TAJ88496.1 MAG: response regulator [Reyranella sp.]TBR28361.1 MAG: response regulator [Reyranella sp.]
MSSSAGSSNAVSPPCIAIVDDDESVREALGNLLRSVGYEVRAFCSAEEFLDRPEGGAFSCLVTDIQMPGMGGLELQKRIVASDTRLPVILMTAFPRDHMRLQAEELGAAGFLTKPFDASRMIECVERALRPPA